MEHFCCFSQNRPMQVGNQHGGREYDNLQNLLDMTSHENPLYALYWTLHQNLNASQILHSTYAKVVHQHIRNIMVGITAKLKLYIL